MQKTREHNQKGMYQNPVEWERISKAIKEASEGSG
jgi:hypothetical protein